MTALLLLSWYFIPTDLQLRCHNPRSYTDVYISHSSPVTFHFLNNFSAAYLYMPHDFFLYAERCQGEAVFAVLSVCFLFHL
jgi:hypothetical protein